MSKKTQQRSLNSVSRRGFLAVGGVGVVGMSLGDAKAAASKNSRAVIQIVMNGGASQHDTFDPKPNAPREIRGPIRSIATSIAGVHFSEAFPQLAQRADDLVILRSLYHDAAPNHESGLQYLLTGDVVRHGQVPPNIGIGLSQILKNRRSAPIGVRLGGKIEKTGVTAYHGDGAGILESEAVVELPLIEELNDAGYSTPDFESIDPKTKRLYGETRFGEQMWTAARLIESGARYVEINTFNKLEGHKTWDAHGCPQTAPATIFDYRDTIGPQFDKAVGALFDDLKSSGLWKQTLIISSGEMGRTARINEQNGRDHWPHVWSGFLAGGGIDGGQVIGASDESGEAIQDHPIHVKELSGLIGSFMCGEAKSEIRINDELTWQLPRSVSLTG